MDNADQSMQAYETLTKTMPSIGFLSRKKRIIAFLKVTKKAQEMIDKQDISEDNALFLISVMTKKIADFQKSAMTTAMHLAGLNRKIIPAVGLNMLTKCGLIYRCYQLMILLLSNSKYHYQALIT